MTLDEAIKHCLEVAEQEEWFINYPHSDIVLDDLNIESRKRFVAEHRQLAEWLMDYKELRAEIIDLRLYVQMLEEYREKAKRLLKAAVDDINYYVDCYEAHCDECCCDQNNHCHWKHEAEALALIGEDTNVPASADDTNVGGKKEGEQNG